jgi:hypothetical protein
MVAILHKFLSFYLQILNLKVGEGIHCPAICAFLSNPALYTVCTDSGFHSSIQDFQENVTILPRLDHDKFLANYFQITFARSSYCSELCYVHLYDRQWTTNFICYQFILHLLLVPRSFSIKFSKVTRCAHHFICFPFCLWRKVNIWKRNNTSITRIKWGIPHTWKIMFMCLIRGSALLKTTTCLIVMTPSLSYSIGYYYWMGQEINSSLCL